MQGPDDEFADIEFTCSRCGAVMDRFHELCPDCGQELGEGFSATFRPPVPKAIKIIAFVFLGGIVLMLVVLLLGPLLF